MTPVWQNKHPIIAASLVIGVLAVAFVLGHRNGIDYQLASDQTRIVTLDEPEIPASEFDELVYTLDKEALANAYREQIEHVFSIWMKDDTGQPQRAVNGARKARKAFIGAMRELEKKRPQN